MDSGSVVALVAVVALFIGLPWVILHYVTRWKTAPVLTRDDEVMLEELYQLARRLEDRMETVERLAGAENPDFRADPRRRSLEDAPSNLAPANLTNLDFARNSRPERSRP